MYFKRALTSFLNALLFAGIFLKGKILPGFVPNKDDLVIDLGSGDKPFWRADISLDKSSLGHEQRFSAGAISKDSGLFVDNDVSSTPFKDKTFDFSYCSHLLEHVERPDLAIKEITRISKQGYIEVPNGIIELLFPYQSHLWFVFLNKDELIFYRKSKKFHEVLKNNGSKYIYLIKLMKDPFIHLYWKNKIKYKIVDDLKESDKYFTIVDDRYRQPEYINKISHILLRVFRRLFYKEKNSKIGILRKHLTKA